MKKYIVLLFALCSVAQALASIAADKPGDLPVKPASFVPHAHASHVYGSPISSAVVGRAQKAHQKTAHKKSAPVT